MTRTCQARGGGVRLFGVRLTDGSCIQKSASMGNILSHYSAATSSESPDVYHSDDPDHADRRRPIRKKGIAWTEEEHRQFLLGLEKLGKGDWRGISRNYVRSRTSTQVASHAQKYFIRQSNATRKKKRSSLFDMEKLSSSSSPECQLSISTPMGSTKNGKPVLSSSSSSSAQMADTDNTMPCLDLSLKPAFTPFPLQLWPPNANSDEHNHPRTSLKVKQEPIHELMNLSQLTLGETGMLQNESLIFSLSIAGNP